MALAIWAAYLIFFIQLTSFPLQDYPNHVARGVVMADLLFQHGARFGDEFALLPMVVPYILGDLVLATCVHLFGTTLGAGVFTGLVLLSLPCALLFYMSVHRLAPRARLLVVLISVYLATDWFFLMGFMAFRLSVAALLVTLALADLLRRRWSVALFAVYTGALLLSYLIHLSWLVFFTVALGVSGAVRWWLGSGTSVRREIALFAPVLALLAWQHFAVPPQGGGNPPMYDVTSGGILLKLEGLRTEFGGFGGHSSELLLVMLVVCVLWPARHALQRRAWTQPAVVELLALATAFLLIYIALPRNLEHTAYVDLRALPVAVLFAILAVLQVRFEAPGGSAPGPFNSRPVLALALLLGLSNLGYLIYHVGQNNAWMARYRHVVQSVPQGAPVLSIYSGKEADTRPFLHAASFVVIDRGGMTPYIFTADHGDPMLYFRSRQPLYRPAEDWYGAQQTSAATSAPDWRHVACDYHYLLLTEPFDVRRIGVPTRMITANQSAALLEVLSFPIQPTDECPRYVRDPAETAFLDGDSGAAE